jgi:hypothetical protein
VPTRTLGADVGQVKLSQMAFASQQVVASHVDASAPAHSVSALFTVVPSQAGLNAEHFAFAGAVNSVVLVVVRVEVDVEFVIVTVAVVVVFDIVDVVVVVVFDVVVVILVIVVVLVDVVV